METKYYLPISSKCLAHYFGSACIMPSKYFSNKPFDIQNNFEDFLLLTIHIGTNQTDCCLELVFTKNELNDLIEIRKGFYLYQKPLPITRVKSILFSDKKQMEQTIGNIIMSTAFVPEELVKLIPKFDEVETIELEKPHNLNGIVDWSSEIKKFNSFLGGFALMRLAGEEYMNYSENYFSALSFFNDVIKNELIVSGKTINEKVSDAFTGKGYFEKLYPIINKNIDETDLFLIAKEERQTILKDKITRIIDLNSLEKLSFIVAVINTFGVGDEAKKKKIDGLILSNFKSEIKSDKSEVVALCYGLNKGYSVFSNKYKSGNKEKIVKFQLNSQVDYYTIESLFQYVFNGIKTEGFEYLDNWCPKSNVKISSKNKSDYQVLDIIVIGKKKPKVGSKEYLENLFRFFYSRIEAKLFNGNLIDVVDEIIKEVAADKEAEQESIMADMRNEILSSIQLQLYDIDKLLFDKIDKNGDGVLDSEEIASFLHELKLSKSKIHNLSHDGLKSEDKNAISSPIHNEPLANSEKIRLAKEIINYQSLPIKTLEKKAMGRGIKIKGLKKEDIIIQLISNEDNSLFKNE